MGEIKKFFFAGPIAPSKSLMNRALIVQSFFPEFEVSAVSDAEDVIHLQKSLGKLKTSEVDFYCGDGGTTLRFLLARLSRLPGTFRIAGSDRLMSRPHGDLFKALRQLGCEVEQKQNQIFLKSSGWRQGEPVSVDMKTSSQFVSALLLSAWQLPEKLILQGDFTQGSISYLEMTLEFLRKLGMVWQKSDGQIQVMAEQKLTQRGYEPEPDMSSAFAVAALALAGGRATIQNFPVSSLQPDADFVKILQTSGGHLIFENGSLIVDKSRLRGININLQNNPDLFPMLAILLSTAKGDSVLTGLESLPHKESDRIQRTLELLEKVGGRARWQSGRFQIEGVDQFSSQPVEFDPDHDHRMAMAAALANQMGSCITIKNRDVVRKSFADFWQVVGQ